MPASSRLLRLKPEITPNPRKMSLAGIAVTLLTPVVPPPLPFPDPDDRNAPIERQLTKQLMKAIKAAKWATELMCSGDSSGFEKALASGVSANLCGSLAQIIEPFQMLDISVSWACTRPINPPEKAIRFGPADAALLREAARFFREREPKPNGTHFRC